MAKKGKPTKKPSMPKTPMHSARQMGSMAKLAARKRS